jgi:hypothetical protein
MLVIWEQLIVPWIFIPHAALEVVTAAHQVVLITIAIVTDLIQLKLETLE